MKTLSWVVCTDNHTYYDNGEVFEERWEPIAHCHASDDAERVAMALSGLEKRRFYVQLATQSRPYVSFYQLRETDEQL